MKEEHAISMMKRIDSYIRGRLTDAEIDALWVEFLKDPEWYYFFEIEVHIIKLAWDAKQSSQIYF